MSTFSWLSVLVLSILLIRHPSTNKFPPKGTYALISGLNDCPESLTLSEIRTMFSHPAISIDGKNCVGGRLKQKAVGHTDEPLAGIALSFSHSKSVVCYEPVTPVSCGAYVMSASTRLYIFQPRYNFSLPPVIQNPTFGDLSPVMGERFVMREEMTYVVEKERCLFGMDIEEKIQALKELEGSPAPMPVWPKLWAAFVALTGEWVPL